jgi:hypothetical protein
LTTEIRSVPIQEPIPETQPKRSPGRPPALNPDGTRKHPPRGTSTRTRTRTSRTKSLEAEITAFLTVVNSVIAFTPLGTKYDQEKLALALMTPGADMSLAIEKIGDELDEAEIKLLAKGIDAQCQRSPRFRAYIETMLGAGANAGLIATVAMIAARRAARHGIVPEALDPMLGSMMNGGSLDNAMAFVPSSDSGKNEHTGENEPDRTFNFEDTINANA